MNDDTHSSLEVNLLPMSTARHIIAMLRSHIEGDEAQFIAVAMQAAAQEARRGHTKVAQELRELIDDAKGKRSAVEQKGAIPLTQPQGDLANLLSVEYPGLRLSSMVLTGPVAERLQRVLLEQKQQTRLLSHGLTPRRKLLLVGPPGSGKTMTAAALAGELKLPLFRIRLEGIITKFMGETAAKLRLVFDAMAQTRGVYFFDEIDAIGSRRSAGNDVGEIRRILNSFLQFLEDDDSKGLVMAATNHPELLYSALFRRFDDIIEYALPGTDVIAGIMQSRLATFDHRGVDWAEVSESASGMSQADVAKAAEEAAKSAVLEESFEIDTALILSAVAERKFSSRCLRETILPRYPRDLPHFFIEGGGEPAPYTRPPGVPIPQPPNPLADGLADSGQSQCDPRPGRTWKDALETRPKEAP